MSTEIASAYIALTTKMPGVKKEIEASLGEAESVATESGQKSGNAWAQSLAVGLVAGTAVVAAAVGVLATKVISAFGELEQNLGGIARVALRAAGKALKPAPRSGQRRAHIHKQAAMPG